MIVRALLITASALAVSAGAQAQTPTSQSAGLRRLDVASKPASTAAPAAEDQRPRRYSLHWEYHQTPDPIVLPPAFFEKPSAEAGHAPEHDRWGRPIVQPASDNPSS